MYLQRCLTQSAEQLADLNFEVTPTPGMYLLPAPLADYHKQFSYAKISVKLDNTAALCEALDNGIIDFAIVEGYLHKKDYDSLLYKREPYFAVCSAQYTFQSTSKMSDLQSETLLVREAGAGSRFGQPSNFAADSQATKSNFGGF